MKCFHPDHSQVEIGIRLEKFPEYLRRNIATTRERDVRMPPTQIRLQAGAERSFLDAFVNLEKMGMTVADPNPNDFRRPSGGKRSGAGNWEKKRTEMDDANFFPQL